MPRPLHLSVRRPRPSSEELPEFLTRKASILSDTAHSVCVDGIVTRDGQDPTTIGHHDVFALANDSETSLLQGPHRLQVRNAGNLRHYTMTSISRTSAPLVCSATTAMYSWMATRMFSRASASF